MREVPRVRLETLFQRARVVRCGATDVRKVSIGLYEVL